VHPRCGQTWLDTFGEIAKFYSSNNQLSALQIVTWNDYDEGTAMEMDIDNCIYLQPSISGSTLSWNVGGGPEDTIDHYTVFSSADGQNLAKLADVPAGTHALDLGPFNLTSGTFTLYVKATGRPSIQNKMSPPITFHAGDQPPAVNLAVSQTGALTFKVSTAVSAGPAGSVASSTIDFGDGTTVAGPNASHIYTTVGVYNITATVVDNAGASAVAVQRVSAKALTPGVTIFSPSPSGVVNWPTPSFVASANGANPITRMSVLVDGTQVYAIDQDIMNTALKIYAGNHHVEVQTVDSTGASSSAAIDITAEPSDPAPVPAIQVTPLPQVGPNTVLLCGAGWQDPSRFVNAYRWTFSDGSPAAFIPGVVHTFPTLGTFSTTESVINEFGSPGSVTQSLNVSGASTASPAIAVHVQDEQTQRQNLPIRLP
jgi:PKD repeat protein